MWEYRLMSRGVAFHVMCRQVTVDKKTNEREAIELLRETIGNCYEIYNDETGDVFTVVIEKADKGKVTCPKTGYIIRDYKTKSYKQTLICFCNSELPDVYFEYMNGKPFSEQVSKFKFLLSEWG